MLSGLYDAHPNIVMALAGLTLLCLLTGNLAPNETDQQQRQRENLRLRLAEANARVDELVADLRHESDQLAVNRRQLALLEGKSKRAQDLADRNTLPIEAAEDVGLGNGDDACGVGMLAVPKTLATTRSCASLTP